MPNARQMTAAQRCYDRWEPEKEDEETQTEGEDMEINDELERIKKERDELKVRLTILEQYVELLIFLVEANNRIREVEKARKE